MFQCFIAEQNATVVVFPSTNQNGQWLIDRYYLILQRADIPNEQIAEIAIGAKFNPTTITHWSHSVIKLSRENTLYSIYIGTSIWSYFVSISSEVKCLNYDAK